MSKLNTKICTGYQAVVEAAIQFGCRTYYASPSPFHSSLLNEGSQRFPAANGWFVQAESPASALAMAQGTAAAGHLVLVSGNDQDFLAMQEVLGYCVVQRLPIVLTVLNDGGPAMALPRPAGHQMRYYLSARAVGGFPLISYVPSTPQHAYTLTLQAFASSLEWRQPVVLLLEPPVFHAANVVQISRRSQPWIDWDNASQAFIPDEKEAIQQLAALEDHIRQKGGTAQIYGQQTAFREIRLACASLAAWLQTRLPPETCLVVPETLYPFPFQVINALKAQLPADGTISYWEYDYPWMAQVLSPLFPEWNLQSRVINFESELWPAGGL